MNAPIPPIREGAKRAGIAAAGATVVGVVLSGPLAMILVQSTHPQPAWAGAQTFAASYHPVQVLPYLGGIVLVSALLMLLASLHAAAEEELTPRTGAALIFGAAFAALICLNYGIQTTFLPVLVQSGDRMNDPLIAALTMVNPTSLAWAIEMWGWGVEPPARGDGGAHLDRPAPKASGRAGARAPGARDPTDRALSDRSARAPEVPGHHHPEQRTVDRRVGGPAQQDTAPAGAGQRLAEQGHHTGAERAADQDLDPLATSAHHRVIGPRSWTAVKPAAPSIRAARALRWPLRQ
jgi:hypothetical protein